MLLTFSLENHGAFAHQSTLNLFGSKLKDPDDGRLVDIGNITHIRALTSSVVLGKNGSGKSTFVDALNFVSRFVRHSARDGQLGDEIMYNPNLLIDELRTEATKYGVVFSMRGIVYEFSFSHNGERVIHERLHVADNSSRFRKLYERQLEPDGDYTYSFGDALSGRRTLWQESTRDNALYLSTAVQLNAESLKAPFEWLSKFLRPIDIDPSFQQITAGLCQNDENKRRQIVRFLQALDIDLFDIEIDEDEIDRKSWQSMFNEAFIEKILKASETDEKSLKQFTTYFIRKRLDGSPVRFKISQESTGTQALFGLAGPLFDTLENGYCLIVDEINTSLHPIVLRFLIDLFSDPRLNKKRAQLIFTTHDTSVVSISQMRRDQVWFVDADGNGASLSPLTDFSPRKGEAIDRGYLGGRYGGLPVVNSAFIDALVDSTH